MFQLLGDWFVEDAPVLFASMIRVRRRSGLALEQAEDGDPHRAPPKAARRPTVPLQADVFVGLSRNLPSIERHH
jgi:hypothetical protein